MLLGPWLGALGAAGPGASVVEVAPREPIQGPGQGQGASWQDCYEGGVQQGEHC